MNRNGRIEGISRFLRWQIAMRLVRSPIIFSWMDGVLVVVAPGESGITQNVYCGLHEHLEMGFLLHVIGTSDLFVDIGANVGSYTLLACGVKKAKGVAFEPVPSTFRKLKTNLAINDLTATVELLQCGVGAEEGELRFTSSENCTNHVLAANEQSRSDSVSVPIHRLDHILGDRSPTVIKIDVEGFESAVIDGAKNVLAQPSLLAVIMELNGSGSRYGYDESVIVETMRSFGFETATYDPFKREIIMLDGKCLLSGNTIFVRNITELNLRIKNAPRIKINSVEI